MLIKLGRNIGKQIGGDFMRDELVIRIVREILDVKDIKDFIAEEKQLNEEQKNKLNEVKIYFALGLEGRLGAYSRSSKEAYINNSITSERSVIYNICHELTHAAQDILGQYAEEDKLLKWRDKYTEQEAIAIGTVYVSKKFNDETISTLGTWVSI